MTEPNVRVVKFGLFYFIEVLVFHAYWCDEGVNIYRNYKIVGYYNNNRVKGGEGTIHTLNAMFCFII